MTEESISSGKTDKPEKPYPGFPLYAHGSGRWAKKIRQKLHYFGRWGNRAGDSIVPVSDVPASATEALEEFNRQYPYLSRGRTVPQSPEGMTLRDLVNQYLTHKQHQLDAGEITGRTFKDAYKASQRVLKAFGKGRLASDLNAEDFAALRQSLATTLSALALGIEIQRIRSVFKFGIENGHLEQAVRYGQSFTKPARRIVRLDRQKRGPRMFESEEMRTMIEASGNPLRAMILLAVNAGMGNRDVALLPMKAVNLETGWIDYPRQKTAVPRRVPLWPETIKAISQAIAKRRKPTSEEHSELVFITLKGECFVKHSGGTKGAWTDSVGLAFGKLLRKLDLKRPGLNFYALRHTFRTVADECRDQPAIDSIMGHAPDTSNMATVYRERIGDDRLRAVTETVRTWLWPKSGENDNGTKKEV